jgi:hypothetical protein
LLCDKFNSIKEILWLIPPIINLDKSSSIMLAGRDKESLKIKVKKIKNYFFLEKINN